MLHRSPLLLLLAGSLLLSATGAAQDPKTKPAQTAAPGEDPDDAPRPPKARKPKVARKPLPQKVSNANRVNINAASLEDLKKVPGISEGIASKIISSRPFRTKADLVVKGIISQGQYVAVKDKVFAGDPPAAPKK